MFKFQFQFQFQFHDCVDVMDVTEGVGLRWSLRLEIATHAMIIYFVLPIVLISAIFSIIYPVVIFIYTYTTTNATIGETSVRHVANDVANAGICLVRL